jgi:uncharacterized protein YutE (UPF0331/DUF86 family)
MTIDADLVTRKMLLITSDLDVLRPVAESGLDAYLSSPMHQAAVERYLERSIGRMIDINYHLLTESGHPPPPDYHASFTRLSELRVLDEGFARQIARAAGVRNRLVHEYEALDPRKVFEALGATLRDVPQYLSQVSTFIAAREA